MDSREDKAFNLARAKALSLEALRRGARLVALPEYFYYRGPLKNAGALARIAEPVKGPSVALFAELARAYQAHLLLGSIYERIEGGHKAFNTSVLIGPDGKVTAVYRKQHLFHMLLPKGRIREADIFRPGNKKVMAKAGALRIGMAVCFDIRFPDLFEAYARQGANVFTVPSAFSRKTGEAHWEVLVRARAIETFSYVLAPNQSGENGAGVPSWGHSMIVGPWGEVLAQAGGTGEAVIMADIDPARVRGQRACFPGFKKIMKG
jgi:predicted amidohydrolase